MAEETLAEARESAWDDASGKAQQYADLAGRSLGAVLSVSEPRGGRGGAVAAAARSPSAPVEPGTHALHAAVRVRWELT